MTITIKVRWLVLTVMLVTWTVFPSSVFSQSSAQPLPTECPVVNTFDKLDIGLCVNEENGDEYYIDTMGFMMPRPQ